MVYNTHGRGGFIKYVTIGLKNGLYHNYKIFMVQWLEYLIANPKVCGSKLTASSLNV